MLKIRVSNKDRVEDDMEEILQDPAKFEELLKELEQPQVKPVKIFAKPPLPLMQSFLHAKVRSFANSSRGRMAPSHLTTPGGI